MPRETLPNGIELPEQWPPRGGDPASRQPMRVPYLESPPAIIPIDLGRQLFVDDFLVEKTSMARVYPHPVKHTGNPVFFPQTPHERNDDLPPCTIPKCGGVWFDDRDGVFKMWYMASYLGQMALALSNDGIHWQRPTLDVVPGTNFVLPEDLHPDSGTAWIDTETDDESARYKMLIREPNPPGKPRFPGLVMTSPDGVHWSEPVRTGPMDDRSTIFYNPFRKKWVHSIRSGGPHGRNRLYREHADFFEAAKWEAGEPVYWTGADCMDLAGDSPPQLYNLDAIAYESLMLGFYQVHKGPPNPVGESRGLPKLTELVLATSRDGFHWHRPDRTPFIAARRVPGSWEYGYVESTGGVCVVVGDEMWFYYSAYGGDENRLDKNWRRNGTYANGAVGLAKLRRDGFAAMEARTAGASLTTRPVTFSGARLFVNANTAGADLRVEVLGDDGEATTDLGLRDCVGWCGNSTCAEVRWRNEKALASVAGQPVRLRFTMDRGSLYSFWVADATSGESNGYRAAGQTG